MSVPSWCRVGQRVVCIRDDWDRGYGEVTPLEGETYTIRSVEVDEGHVWFKLVEIVNTPRPYSQGVYETDWDYENFRPVVDDKSDNEIESRLYHERRQHHKAPARKVVSA
jgi:hypothetical protein